MSNMRYCFTELDFFQFIYKSIFKCALHKLYYATKKNFTSITSTRTNFQELVQWDQNVYAESFTPLLIKQILRAIFDVATKNIIIIYVLILTEQYIGFTSAFYVSAVIPTLNAFTSAIGITFGKIANPIINQYLLKRQLDAATVIFTYCVALFLVISAIVTIICIKYPILRLYKSSGEDQTIYYYLYFSTSFLIYGLSDLLQLLPFQQKSEKNTDIQCFITFAIYPIAILIYINIQKINSKNVQLWHFAIIDIVCRGTATLSHFIRYILKSSITSFKFNLQALQPFRFYVVLQIIQQLPELLFHFYEPLLSMLIVIGFMRQSTSNSELAQLSVVAFAILRLLSNIASSASDGSTELMQFLISANSQAGKYTRVRSAVVSHFITCFSVSLVLSIISFLISPIITSTIFQSKSGMFYSSLLPKLAENTKFAALIGLFCSAKPVACGLAKAFENKMARLIILGANYIFLLIIVIVIFTSRQQLNLIPIYVSGMILNGIMCWIIALNMNAILGKTLELEKIKQERESAKDEQSGRISIQQSKVSRSSKASEKNGRNFKIMSKTVVNVMAESVLGVIKRPTNPFTVVMDSYETTHSTQQSMNLGDVFDARECNSPLEFVK